MRLPKRSWVRSSGGFSLASSPSGSAAAEPAKAPTSLSAVLGPLAALAAQRLDQDVVRLNVL